MAYMRSKERRLRSSKLYLILDKGSLKNRTPIKAAERAIAAGIDIIQLRDKHSSDKEIIGYGKSLKRIADSNGVLFIINDRIDICKILGADGVHLGQDDIPLKKARSALGKNKIIGMSCHTLKEAMKAQNEKADYIAMGPIFKTSTKPTLKPRGLRLLKKVTKELEVPVVAIGGINKRNIRKVMGSGVDMIAAASAILKRKNIKEATGRLRKIITK